MKQLYHINKIFVNLLTPTLLPLFIFCDSSLLCESVATASTWYLRSILYMSDINLNTKMFLQMLSVTFAEKVT